MSLETESKLIESAAHKNKETLSNAKLYEVMKPVFGFTFVTGLPCGELRYFIAEASTDREVLHLPTSNEREAVGIAAGAWLAGEKPVLYMQNSGLFLASNDIGSLLLACKIPVPIVASWRGVPGETATQHFATGAATEPLLDAFRVPHVSEANMWDLIALYQKMQELQSPVCVLKVREKFNEPPQVIERTGQSRNSGVLVVENNGNLLINREEAITGLMQKTKQDIAVISSTGLISRSVYESFDGSNQFYNAGAFGLTSSIGLGLAVSRPDIRVMVIEGDGSVLADIGNLNLIGYRAPRNFVHVILNNRSYASCSGEPTCQPELIPKLACQFGYDRVYSVNSQEGIGQAYDEIMNRDGLQMLHIGINTDGKRSFARPTTMVDIARRFQAHFSHD